MLNIIQTRYLFIADRFICFKPLSRACLTFMVLMVAMALSTLSHAQSSSSDLPSVPDMPGTEQQDWKRQLGLLLIYWPEYEGSDDYESVVFPLFVYEYKKRYFIHYINGIGMHVINNDRFKLSTSLTYTIGREEDDSPRLQGLGDIDPGTAVAVAGEYSRRNFSFSLGIVNPVSGDDNGYLANIEVGYTDVVSDRLILKYALTTSYAESEYMQSYFSISASQSAASGLASFEAEAGLKNAGAQISGIYIVNDNWSLQGQLRYEVLLGDAADSPVVLDENRYTIAVALAYSY